MKAHQNGIAARIYLKELIAVAETFNGKPFRRARAKGYFTRAIELVSNLKPIAIIPLVCR